MIVLRHIFIDIDIGVKDVKLFCVCQPFPMPSLPMRVFVFFADYILVTPEA